jgi:hypothetical protein
LIVKTIGFMNGLRLLGFALLLNGCGGGATSAPAIAVPKPPLAEMSILVIGQSISSNCNEHVYGPVDNVLQVARTGEIKAARDPFEWAGCSGGSMWMPLGKKLIDAGVAAKVVFMPIGVSGSHVEDWQAGGASFSKLNDAIATIQQQGLRFDFAFWHQGTGNIGTNRMVYLERLSSVVGYLNERVAIKRWMIAVHSRCSGLYDTDIEAAQLEFGNAPELGRYPGPNTNLLGNEYRVDTCHLNQMGQEEMASMWLKSVKNALQ